MTRQAAALSPSIVMGVAEDGSEVARLVVGTELYTREVVFRACYIFTDRCYLLLKPHGENEIIVEFRKRALPTPLSDVIGAFCNELINQRVRADIARETQRIRELIVTQAFAEADFRGPRS
jgi:His-Xaa-Ser system protein HxsD